MTRSGAVIFVFILLTHTAAGQQITWYKHIAPLIHANCTPCHRDGDAAPFTLETYEDVAKRGDFIKKVTQSRYMPPWKPDPHYTSFLNERRLTDEEIAQIAEWVDHRMPHGDEADYKEGKKLLPGTRYHRKPDMVLTMNKPFHLKGDNKERFVVYKIPFELPDSMNVEAVEFTASNKRVVHHANYEVDAVPDLDLYNTVDHINLTDDSREQYEQYVPYRKHMIYYGGWIPGSSYESYPEDIGWVMPKRGVILLTVHYGAVGKEEENISGVQLFFTKKQVKRSVQAVSFGSGGVGEKQIDPFFYIPANAVKTFKLKISVPEDQSVLCVWPHMHNLGKIYRAYGVSPAGDTIRLVSINDWDVKLQEIYWFPALVKLPKGTMLMIEGTYDNTADNPANPSNPPQLVYSNGDMRSTDEMMTMVMIFLPYKKGDEMKKL